MSEQAITEIEITIKEAEKFVALAKALDRLHANSDFKQLITEGFFKEEAIRLVHLKADPNMQKPENQENILKDIDGIGVLRNYFGAVYQRAEWAMNAIKDGEEELEELRQEVVIN